MGQSTEELTNQIEETRRNLTQDVDQLNDRVNPGRVVARRKEAARSRLGGLRDRVMGSTQHARDKAPSPTDAAHGALGTVEERTEGNPLAAGLVAFGAGMVLSALLPASDAEARAAQRAVETAREHGVVDEAKSAGQEMGQHLKESATDAAQEVRSSAQDSAQTVKDEGRSSARTVQEDAKQRS